MASQTSTQIPKFLRLISLRKSIPYEVATEIQNYIVSQQLAYKTSQPSLSENSSLKQPPKPIILTFGTSPVYTFGRRERISDQSKSFIDSLIAPMPGKERPGEWPRESHKALLFETKRGGQTTFHGPGQILIWPIMDIKNAWPACGRLDVRGYVKLLEECTILTLKHYNCKGIRTENPGVWEASGKKKIAALGVHLRRNISSFGIACNLTTDLRFFERIVPCGLEGKGTTSVKELTGKNVDPIPFATIWAFYMARLLYGSVLDHASASSLSSSLSSSKSPEEVALISKKSPKVKRVSLKKIGLKPELMRRLWYLDATKEVVQQVQKLKKVNIENDMRLVEESLLLNSIVLEDDSPSPSPAQSNQETNPESSQNIDKILDTVHCRNKNITEPSFRKCAGISYWSPPIGGSFSSPVVRKVAINDTWVRSIKH